MTAAGDTNGPITKREYESLRDDLAAMRKTLTGVQVSIGRLEATIKSTSSTRQEGTGFTMWIVGALMMALMMLATVGSLGVSIYLAGSQ